MDSPSDVAFSNQMMTDSPSGQPNGIGKSGCHSVTNLAEFWI